MASLHMFLSKCILPDTDGGTGGAGIRSMHLNMNRIPADTKKCELNQWAVVTRYISIFSMLDRMTSSPLVWSEDLIHVPGPRSNPGESCALKSGRAGIRSRFLDLDRILADAKEHWGARDSIHAPGHGSNPSRCKRVSTEVWGGPGFDPCTWTWIESRQMQKRGHSTNELS